MQRNRRHFLRCTLAGMGSAALAAGFWAGTSERRAARWLRRILADARRRIAPAPVKPDPSAWSDNAVTLSWLGHATVLINFYGIRILTDPVFFSCVGISWGLGTVGPKRYVASALRPGELPAVDVVLLSHAHMDHMDLRSLRPFASRWTVTAWDTEDILAGLGFGKRLNVLRWNERVRFQCDRGDLEIEAFEVKHWGERWPSERPRGYNGYLLRREGKALLFSGDTAQTPSFDSLRPRGPFTAAIMPIGAYNPWIWNHCTPEQAVQLADSAGARHIVPVHHQTFRLSHEPMNEPIERFDAALAKEADRIALRRIGETFVG